MKLADLRLDITDVGNGAPLLYLGPGLFTDLNAQIVDTLATRYRVIAPRYPGFDGRQPPADFRSIEDLNYLCLDLLDGMGLSDIRVLGSSLGGWIALEMAVRDPTRFSNLILLSPLGVKAGSRTARDFADLAAMSTQAAQKCLFGQPGSSPDLQTFTDAELESLGRERQFLAYYAWNPYLHNPRLRRWLHRARMPVRLVWGSADGFNPVANASGLLDRLPNAQLSVLDGVGHFPQLEAGDALLDIVVGDIEGPTS